MAIYLPTGIIEAAKPEPTPEPPEPSGGGAFSKAFGDITGAVSGAFGRFLSPEPEQPGLPPGIATLGTPNVRGYQPQDRGFDTIRNPNATFGNVLDAAGSGVGEALTTWANPETWINSWGKIPGRIRSDISGAPRPSSDPAVGLGTELGTAVESVPVAGPVARRAFQIGAAPGAAGMGLSSLLLTSAGGVGARAAAEQAGLPEWAQTVADVAGSVAVPVAGNMYASAVRQGRRIPAGLSVEDVAGAPTPEDAAALRAKIAAEGMTPENKAAFDRMSGQVFANAPEPWSQPPPPVQPGSTGERIGNAIISKYEAAPATASERLFGVTEPQGGLSRVDEAVNSLKRAVGIGVPQDEIATPIMRQRRSALRASESQAARVGSIADTTQQAFTLDKAGRITTLPGSPTIQDLAARLPEYEQLLTAEQRTALALLRDEIAPFSEALREQGVDIASRADVKPGGFYLPRGRADLEGADAPIKVGTGRGGAGGKKGFERGAVFDSMADGIDAGYRYASFRDAMQSYAQDVGKRVADAWASRSFAATGLGESAADRIDPGLRSQVQTLRAKITSRLDTIQRQGARLPAQEQAARDAAGEVLRLRRLSLSAETRSILRKATVEEHEVWMPDVVRESVPDAAALQERANRLRDRIASGKGNAGALAKQLGEVEALTDIRRAADSAGDDYGAMLSGIEDAASRAADYTGSDAAPVARVSGTKAPAFGTRERVDWEADRRMRGIGRSRSAQGPTAPQAPFEGPPAAYDAYEATLTRALGHDTVDVSRTPSTDAVIRAAERELRILEREANRAEGAAQRSQTRADRTRNAQSGAMSEVAQLRQQLDGILPRWERAKERAMQTPRNQGSIGFAGLNGTTFPDEVANVANKYLADERPPTGRSAVVVRAVDAVNGLLRGVRATADVSFTGIQGLLGAVQHPREYAIALRVAFKSMGDPAAFGAYINDFDTAARAAGRPDSATWGAIGTRIGGTNTEFQIGAGLQRVGPAIQNLPVVKQSNRAFGTFGDVLRLASDDALYQSRAAAGKPVEAAEMAEIAKFSNLMTGWSERRFLGEFGATAQFAPRFFQSQLDLVGNALTSNSITGQQARLALGKLIAVGSTITLAANAARGYETDVRPGSPNFMRIRDVGGTDISLFGPWDSLLRGTVNALQGDWTYLARSKASPVVALSWDLISGKSFTGENTRTPEYLLRSLLPFSLADIGKPNQSIIGTAIGLTGVKATPLSPTDNVQLGRYRELTGEQQFPAIKAQAWKEVQATAPAQFRSAAADYESMYDWYKAAHDVYQQKWEDRGLSTAEAQRRADAQTRAHPIYRAYVVRRKQLTNQWVREHPDLARKMDDDQADLPPDERTFSPTRQQRAVIAGQQ